MTRNRKSGTRERRRSVGRIARKLFESTDIDRNAFPEEPIVELRRGRDERFSKIKETEIRQTNEVLVRTQKPMSALEERLDQLRDKEGIEEERYTERLEERNKRKATMDRWDELGLKDRVHLAAKLPAWAHWLLVAALAFVDFWIFATAVAVQENVDASFSSGAFWMGGVLGLGLFGFGWLLARALKKAVLTFAKDRIARRVRSEHPDAQVPEVGSPDLGLIAVLGFFFVALLAIGLRIRLAAEVESIPLILFQMAVPVLVVVVEYAFFDPTVVPPEKRRLTHRLIRDRRKAVESRLGTVLAERALRLEGIREAAAQRIETEALSAARVESRLRNLLEGIGKTIDERRLANAMDAPEIQRVHRREDLSSVASKPMKEPDRNAAAS